MNRRRLIGVLGTGAGLLLAGYGGLFGTWARLRYRITVVCDTPDGEKTASAVQEIRAYDPIRALQPVNNGSRRLKGDAIVMMVGGKPYFIGLNMCSELVADAMEIGKVTPPIGMKNGFMAETVQAFADAKASALMDGIYRSSLPSRFFGLKTFRDLARFDTLEVIMVRDSNLLWKLKSVFVEVTNESVTRQTSTVLPWLATLSTNQVRRSGPNHEFLLRNIGSFSDLLGGGW